MSDNNFKEIDSDKPVSRLSTKLATYTQLRLEDTVDAKGISTSFSYWQ